MNWILDVLYFLNPRDTASFYVMWGILTLLAELSMGNSHPVCSSVCVCVYFIWPHNCLHHSLCCCGTDTALRTSLEVVLCEGDSARLIFWQIESYSWTAHRRAGDLGKSQLLCGSVSVSLKQGITLVLCALPETMYVKELWKPSWDEQSSEEHCSVGECRACVTLWDSKKPKSNCNWRTGWVGFDIGIIIHGVVERIEVWGPYHRPGFAQIERNQFSSPARWVPVKTV